MTSKYRQCRILNSVLWKICYEIIHKEEKTVYYANFAQCSPFIHYGRELRYERVNTPSPPIEGIASRPIILKKRGAHRDLRMGKIKSHYTLLILLINIFRTMKL